MYALAVDRIGAGSPAVVLHGCPTTIHYLDPLIDALARDHEVLRVHLPGYGRSAAAPSGADLAWTNARVVEALAGLGPVALVGFSGGAYRALWLAVERSLAISRLVLLAPIAHIEPAEQQGFRDFAAALRAGVDLRGILPARMLSPARAADPVAAAEVMAWADAITPAALADELEAFAIAPDLRARCGTIDVPTLMVVGENDVPAPAARGAEIAALIPGARFELLPGVAHSLLHEACDRTIELVVAHLAR